MILVVVALLLMTLPELGQNSSVEKNGDGPQLTDTVQITKIDAKNKILQVRNLADFSRTTTSDSGPRRRPGGGRPRTSFPDNGGNDVPGGEGSRISNKGLQYKVYITETTVMTDGDNSIEFSDFQVGKRISIWGIPKGKGKDLEAKKISVAEN